MVAQNFDAVIAQLTTIEKVIDGADKAAAARARIESGQILAQQKGARKAIPAALQKRLSRELMITASAVETRIGAAASAARDASEPDAAGAAGDAGEPEAAIGTAGEASEPGPAIVNLDAPAAGAEPEPPAADESEGDPGLVKKYAECMRKFWKDPVIHPAADALPMMTDAELDALAADIKANGLQEPITLWRDNTAAAEPGHTADDEMWLSYPLYVLDGRNRLAALKRLGITDPKEAPKGPRHNRGIDMYYALKRSEMRGDVWTPNVDPAAFVLSLNVHRRHLTTEQRRAALEASLKVDPQKSDREHGRRAGVDHKTAAAKRKQLEINGEIPHKSQREEASGRAARGTKPAAPEASKSAAAQPNPEPAGQEGLTPTTQAEEDPVTPAPIDDVIAAAPTPGAAERAIVRTRRRRPLPDAFKEQVRALRKPSEILTRLVEDERFARNRPALSGQRYDLERTRDVIQAALDALSS